MPKDHPNPSHINPHHAIETPLPGPFDDELRPQDPGSSTSRLFALVGAILIAAITIVWQHTPEDTQYKALQLTQPPIPESHLVYSALDEISMVGHMAVKFNPFLASNPDAKAQLISQIETGILTTEDQIIAAIVLAELESPEAALERLAQIRDDLATSLTLPPANDDALTDDPETSETPEALADPSSVQSTDQAAGSPAEYPADPNAEIRQDLNDLTTIYLAGSGALDDVRAARLRARYRFFAKVALSHDLKTSSEAYRQPRSGGLLIMFGLLGFGAMVILAFLAGLVMLTLGMIRYAGHPEDRAFEAPAPGGSVMLETYALFVGSFLVVAVTSLVLASTRPEPEQQEMNFLMSLGLQFATVAVVLWPLLRGMPFAQWRQAMGLVAPRGLIREIGFGFLAYLAAVPLFIAGTLVTLIILIVQEIIRSSSGDALPAEPPSNGMLDIVASGNWLVIVIIALLATVWAPITEELIFRGALYRHLRARLHWVLAALLTAILFAAMHNYPVFMLTPLIALGVMFAVMREIRGSIVASITAHFMHNATLLLVMGIVIRPLVE